jgi:hypothetical protein
MGSRIAFEFSKGKREFVKKMQTSGGAGSYRETVMPDGIGIWDVPWV